jgi:transcriptional regulator with XRE-family HTH domain
LAKTAILAHQLKAARALARLDQQELSNRSGVSVPTIKRMEAGDGPIRGNYENVAAVVGVLEAAGIEFIPENGGGPGARLRTTATTPTAAPASASKPSPRRLRPRRSAGRAFPGSEPAKRGPSGIDRNTVSCRVQLEIFGAASWQSFRRASRTW